jgi:ribonuclease BN (tRNA processing enzyme)
MKSTRWSTRKGRSRAGCEFHTSSTELAQIAAKAKPKLLVLYHQLIRGATDKALVREVRKDYRGRVVSAHDPDLY